MKCNLQCYQPLQSTAAIHTEELLAFLASPGTHVLPQLHIPNGRETRVERVQAIRPLCKGRN